MQWIWLSFGIITVLIIGGAIADAAQALSRLAYAWEWYINSTTQEKNTEIEGQPTE